MKISTSWDGEVSPEWKEAMAEHRKVTLTLFSCNTGSEIFLQHKSETMSETLIENPDPIAEKFSKQFPNVTVIAPSGYINVGVDDKGNAINRGISNGAIELFLEFIKMVVQSENYIK